MNIPLVLSTEASGYFAERISDWFKAARITLERRAMMEMTTRSSMSVNPFLGGNFFIMVAEELN